MSDFIGQIRKLIRVGEVRISEHGYDELMEDNLAVRELIAGVNESVIVEEYPDYPKGPCILLLQKDFKGRSVHVVWGIPKGYDSPAVLVTAYRPDPGLWSKDFLKRQ